MNQHRELCKYSNKFDYQRAKYQDPRFILRKEVSTSRLKTLDDRLGTYGMEADHIFPAYRNLFLHCETRSDNISLVSMLEAW